VPILVWLIVAIVAFDVVFVAVRLWATRPRHVVAHRPHGLAPAYATVQARRRPQHRRRLDRH
jgi:hypothetical protein